MADTIRTRAELATLFADNVLGNISEQDLRDFLKSCILRGDYDADFVFGSPQMDDDGDTDHDARMFFDKSKGAFRVGKVTGDEWDEENVGGLSSIAMGNNAKAQNDGTIAIGNNTVASNQGSVAIGWNVTAKEYYSRAEGIDSVARLVGQKSWSSGKFVTKGDCQSSKLQVRCSTTDATPTEPEYQKLFLEDEHSYACTVTIHGRQDTGANHAMYKRMLIIERTGGTVAIVGSVQTIGTDIESNANWGIDLTADDTNKSLKVEVTGDIGQNIRWTALIETVELGYSD